VPPCSRLVGVIATEMVVTAFRVTSALSTCAVSLDVVQARARMCVWVDSVHVKDTADPVLALAVQTGAVPEVAAVTVVAVPAAPHAGGACTAAAAER